MGQCISIIQDLVSNVLTAQGPRRETVEIQNQIAVNIPNCNLHYQPQYGQGEIHCQQPLPTPNCNSYGTISEGPNQ